MPLGGYRGASTEKAAEAVHLSELWQKVSSVAGVLPQRHCPLKTG